MAPTTYPPRSRPFPPWVALTPAEEARVEDLARSLLTDYLGEYAHFQRQSQGEVLQDWDLVTKTPRLDIFRSHQPLVTMTGARLPRFMANGTLQAPLDDIMLATLATTDAAMQTQRALLPMHRDGLDGRVLHVINSPSKASPFEFTGVKWLLHRAPGGLPGVVRKRDFVVLEATGSIRQSDGERLGYHLRHSLDLRAVPEHSERAIVRGNMTFCHFYRQLAPAQVEVWSIGAMDLRGRAWRNVLDAEVTRAIRIVEDLPKLARAKKLMWLRHRQHGHRRPLSRRVTPLQHSHYGYFGPAWHRQQRCEVCSEMVCAGCMQKVDIITWSAPDKLTEVTLPTCVGCITCITELDAHAIASQLVENGRLTPRPHGGNVHMTPTGWMKAILLRRRRTCSVETATTSSVTGSTLSSTPQDELALRHQLHSDPIPDEGHRMPVPVWRAELEHHAYWDDQYVDAFAL